MSDAELADLLDRVSASVARQYGVGRADLYQEGWVWCLSHRSKVDEYGGAVHGTGKLWTALRNHMSLLARQEKAHRDGYDVEDQYHYSIGQVRTLLTAAFTPDWSTRGQAYDKDPGSGGSSSGAGDPADVWVMVADVRKGFTKLADRDKQLLWAVFGEPGEWQDHVQELAVEADCTPSAMDKRVRRALGRIRKQLGGPRPREERE